jgi:hypothetical protein
MGLWVSLHSPYMYSGVGVRVLKLPDGIFCEYVFLGYPLVLRIGIALPFDEILQLAPSSETVTSRQGRSPDLGYVDFRMTKH